MGHNFYAALEITGIGMAGIFIFMILFIFIIKGIDWTFPQKEDLKRDMLAKKAQAETTDLSQVRTDTEIE